MICPSDFVLPGDFAGENWLSSTSFLLGVFMSFSSIRVASLTCPCE